MRTMRRRPAFRHDGREIGFNWRTNGWRKCRASDGFVVIASQRMSSELGLFPRAFSLAVHELRTPITVAAGYLRMLLREQAGPLTEQQRKMLQEADKSCARIGSLVAEMSELGKLEDGQIKVARVPFDLGALIGEVASSMHEGEDRGVRLETRVPGPVMVA